MNMTAKRNMKKWLAAGLATIMVVSGGTSVFAAGKGKGHERDNGRIESSAANAIQFNGKNDVKIYLNFNDVKGGDVEWAIKNIASLAAKRVFEGYEDGSFQPRKPISHIEAITAAVRLMGLRDQAESQAEMSTQLNFSDAAKIAQKYPWAVGYVAVAAENDLFLETDSSVQPEKPADRLWATILLVKALKLDTEAKANMNAKLSFRDADKIPAGAVGYIKVAVDKGLIQGYEDNTFRPERPVSRAELAALLDRTGDQIPDNEAVTGKVSAAVSNNVLTLLKDGVTTQVTLDPNAFIYRDGVKVAASALQVGDEVKVRSYNNTAIFVEVTTKAPAQPTQNTFTVTGTVYTTTVSQGKLSTITINQPVVTNGTSTVQQVTYNVEANATISPAGAQLTTGQNVELQGESNLVTLITLK